MIQKYKVLPMSLKVVCWLNLILGTLNLVNFIITIQASTTQTQISNGANIALMFLVVLGILDKSNFIRIIVLVLSWLGLVLGGISSLAAIVSIGLVALLTLIPLIVLGITIWGLSTAEAKAHFQSKRQQKKKSTGMILAEVEAHPRYPEFLDSNPDNRFIYKEQTAPAFEAWLNKNK